MPTIILSAIKKLPGASMLRLWTILGASLIYAWLVHSRPVSYPHLLEIVDIANYAFPILGSLWVFGDCWRMRREVFASGAPRDMKARWRAALFLGLASLSYGIGSFIWADYELRLKQPCPFPSWCDAAYLCCYPFLFSGVLLLPNRPLPSAMRWRVLMDSGMTMTALVTFSWYFLLGPIVQAGSETTLGMILGVGYPLSDLCALFCLLVVTAHAEEQSLKRVTRLLALGIVGVVSANVPFAYLTLHESYQSGRLTDIGWVLGWGLIALSGCELLQTRPKKQLTTEGVDIHQTVELRNPVLWRAMMPYALVPCTGALVVYMLKHHPNAKLETGVYVGAALLIGLLLLRQVFAILENNNLNRYLREAYRELAEKNERLMSLATTDGMTGLSNHRDFQERLRVELSEAQRHGTPLSLLLLDVDHFKLYNDTFGHPAGDHVLRTLATLLRDAIRDGDLAARYGGEEFAVLLPNAGSDQARATAERIRAAVSAFDFPNRKITVSIGITDISIAGTDPEDLIESADTALYAAKHTGRNRWAIAGDTESLISAA
ncbi:MAG: response regulator/GGDEF domain protein [Capsulimonas sp.]|nr:response regulator/GGDEF domain protein [Capsulimonas sp.]